MKGAPQRLTKAVIERAEPKTSPYVLWDSDLPGFGCRINPTGRRTYIVQYRLQGSRKAYQPSIGESRVISLSQARARAAKMLATARLGTDPVAERKERAAKEAVLADRLTLAQLVEQYVTALRAGTVKTRRRSNGPLAKQYLLDTERHLRRFANKHGATPAQEIDRKLHVLPFLDKLAGQTATHRQTHGSLQRLYAWGRQRGLVTNNPTSDIQTSLPPSRDHTLSLPELAEVWRAAEEIGGSHGDLVKLLVLTGQRESEVAAMVWGEIDLTARRWTMPGQHNKPNRKHVLPLSGLAVELLTARLGTKPPPRDELVLPSVSRDSSRRPVEISGWTKLRIKLEEKSGVIGWRFHDLRRSFVTICAEHGADIGTLDSMLNHAASGTRGGVIGVYQRAALLKPARQVMLLWDGLLRAAIGLPTAMKPEEKIVALPTR